ncbi:type III pantothenate kinase [Opitutus sp. ER46]|uniref:type III pantothenate kinase n=1 Tax=Opitutus sp. ER46 TaxID=2161864 RepID=UPI000D3267B4|nr:type III pantothenate kinase [Opitutus sp. ER46]PTX91768.1 type III pantothenate kinase [Opitutus sp. ER46]
MLLCLDIGNSQMHAGVFDGDTLRLQFRKTTHPLGASDEFGVFFTSVLRENGLDPRAITQVALCSVVPAAVYPIRNACLKYFHHEPFVLQAGVKTGLRVRYRNPLEVGADRIAGAIAAAQRRPGGNLIVVDCGTATTFDVVTSSGDYLGGAILPGIGISVETLAGRTAKLPSVEIARPAAALGRSTVESIQAGVYHAHVGAIRHLVAELSREAFDGNRPFIVATGGFARLLLTENLFDEVVPELVLLGIKRAAELNPETAATPA